MKAEPQRQLECDGFILLKGVISAEQVTRLNTHLEELWAAEGERAGGENYIEEKCAPTGEPGK
ncbi:MAG: hypothetical protein ABI874_01375 [Chloroflexota bacterium]